MGEIPTRIWSAWLQGLDRAPSLVRICQDRWRHLNPGYETAVLDEADVRKRFPELTKPSMVDLPPALRADLLRLALLRENGGVWVDATCFPVQPLDDWMPRSSGFFAFSNPGPDRPLSNWMLGSSPENYLVCTWLEALYSYVTSVRFRNDRMRLAGLALDRILGVNERTAGLWLHPRFIRVVRLRPYFAPHYVFAKLCREDPRFRAEWSSAAKLPADGPHSLDVHGFLQPAGPEIRAQIDHGDVPVYKLNRRVEPTPGSCLAYLLDGPERQAPTDRQ